MNFLIQNLIRELNSPQLNAKEKIIYEIILIESLKDGPIPELKHKDISKRTGIGVVTVRKSINGLIGKKYIKKLGYNGRAFRYQPKHNLKSAMAQNV